MNFCKTIFKQCIFCRNSEGVKYITRLRLAFSRLQYHKFKHLIQDTLNQLCTCSLEVETTCHFLLHCPSFGKNRRKSLEKPLKYGKQYFRPR